jgi:hypothetical protein
MKFIYYASKLEVSVPMGDTKDLYKPAMVPAMKGAAQAVVDKMKKGM